MDRGTLLKGFPLSFLLLSPRDCQVNSETGEKEKERGERDGMLDLNMEKPNLALASTKLELLPEPKKLTINLKVMKVICTLPVAGFERFGKVTETRNGTYVFIDRGAKILAVAHRDTVCDPASHFSYDPKLDRVHNPGLDDRLGCTILLDWLDQLLPENSYDILLTEGEETGRSTAKHFEPPEGKEYNWMFEFDRGGVDAVHYQYTDTEWMAELKTMGCKIEKGAISDISYLEHLGICGVNVGCAYYQYHSPKAFCNLYETEDMMDKFVKFFIANQDKRFEHDAKKFGKWGEVGQYNNSVRGYYNQGNYQPQAYSGYHRDYDSNWGEDWEQWYDSKTRSTHSGSKKVKGKIWTGDNFIDQTDPLAIQPLGHLSICQCVVCREVRKKQDERFLTLEGRADLKFRLIGLAQDKAFVRRDHYFNYCFCSSCIRTREIISRIERGEWREVLFELETGMKTSSPLLKPLNKRARKKLKRSQQEKERRSQESQSQNQLILTTSSSSSSNLNSEKKEGSDQRVVKTPQSFVKFCATKNGTRPILPQRRLAVKPKDGCDWCWESSPVKYGVRTAAGFDLLCRDCKEFLDQGGLEG